MIKFSGSLENFLKLKIYNSDDIEVGSIFLTYLENIEKVNPEIYNLLPDNCPFNFSNTIYGFKLEIKEEFRNMGYGTKLMIETEIFLKEKKINNFFLFRENNNRKLDLFYKRLNFIDIFFSHKHILFYKTIY